MADMNGMGEWVQWLAGASAALWVGGKAKQRLELSFAKHPSLGGHLRMAKRIAKMVPAYSYDETTWFSADGAPAAITTQRRQALVALGAQLQNRSPLTLAHTLSISGGASALRQNRQLLAK